MGFGGFQCNTTTVIAVMTNSLWLQGTEYLHSTYHMVTSVPHTFKDAGPRQTLVLQHR